MIDKKFLESRALKLGESRTHRVYANPRNPRNIGNVHAVHEEVSEVTHEEGDDGQEAEAVVARSERCVEKGRV